jgi:Arc/MetJ family transcription regulator
VRTNIDLDDELIAQAMTAAGLPTKKATVEAGLRALIERKEQKMAFAALEGLGWEGDLDAMREGREFAPKK